MPFRFEGAREHAPVTLGCITLSNGAAGLSAPTTLARRSAVDPEASATALYARRLFGVRTLLNGAQLLPGDGGLHDRSLRGAPFIHVLGASAALSARRQLPRRVATSAALISTVFTVLAVIAQRHEIGGRSGR